ncbi:MAG TPA: AAA family ATPase [Clostridia bacterium]|nr:AAA family ATPase [Clostridia bacterium]
MKNKEILIGAAVGILLFLILQGVNILPLLFIAGLAGILYYVNFSRHQSKNTDFTSVERSTCTISFDDIGGQEVAKNELREALEFMKNDDQIKLLGIRPLRGILLSGPPGTGKTLLAKAAAQFTNSAFLSASGSEFVEMYVGVGAQRVRKLFEQAKKTAKKLKKSSAVIFIDEIEVLGGARGQNNGHQEHDQTLNELLVQMDGISSAKEVKILVIGATNRVDMLDSALLRPGRFDRLVKVDLPDKKGRLHILKLHTKNKPLAVDVNIDSLAKDTYGFSGAQLESVTNEAAILAMREGTDMITSYHFQSAIEKVMMGEKLDRLPSIEEKNRISVHESGHALIGELKLPGSVASVNVASRSDALGYVRQTQENDMYLYTCNHLKSKIAVALAGILAEELIHGNRSTGGTSDFRYASDMAKQIIYSGMSELGIISAEDIPKDQLHSAIAGILKEVEIETYELLMKHRRELKQVTELLLDKETISGDELRMVLKNTSGSECA